MGFRILTSTSKPRNFRVFLTWTFNYFEHWRAPTAIEPVKNSLKIGMEKLDVQIQTFRFTFGFVREFEKKRRSMNIKSNFNNWISWILETSTKINQRIDEKSVLSNRHKK